MIKLLGSKKKIFKIKIKLLVGGSKKKKMKIAPTLSQFNINLRDFINLFDSMSFYIKDGFEINCVFKVHKGEIIDFQLLSSDSSFYISKMFLYKNIDLLSKNCILKLLFEISKLKCNQVNLNHLNLKSICKMYISSLNSYTSGKNKELKKILYV